MDFSNHPAGSGRHRQPVVAATVLAVLSATAGLIAAEASTAPGSYGPCSGPSAKAPGTLTGHVTGNIVITGVCDVNGGPATGHGSITVAAGGGLVSAVAHNDRAHSGSSSLTVSGNIVVDSGATAILGCKASSFPCVDDMKKPTLSSK